MGSSRFRSIFCGPNYVSPGLNRPCFAVSSGAVRARVHAHEHASKSTRSEHRSRGLRGGRVTAKYHQREREEIPSSSPSRTDTTARLMSRPFFSSKVDLRLFIGKINPFSLLFFFIHRGTRISILAGIVCTTERKKE